MSIPLSNTDETKIKMLTDLKNRECIIRINKNGVLMPPLKGTTLDFQSIPRVKRSEQNNNQQNQITKTNPIKFKINNNIDLKDVLLKSSSSRKEFNNE